jgi:hypothetical protein
MRLRREDRKTQATIVLAAEEDRLDNCSYRVPRIAWYSSAEAAASCAMIRYATP